MYETLEANVRWYKNSSKDLEKDATLDALGKLKHLVQVQPLVTPRGTPLQCTASGLGSCNAIRSVNTGMENSRVTVRGSRMFNFEAGW